MKKKTSVGFEPTLGPLRLRGLNHRVPKEITKNTKKRQKSNEKRQMKIPNCKKPVTSSQKQNF